MQLIVRRPRHEHVSQDTVEELEAAILRDMRVAPASASGVMTQATTIATRLIGRAGLDAGRALRASGRHAATIDPARDYFAVMMDLDASRVAPWFVRDARKSVYLFDAWPSKQPEILRFTDSWGVQFAFVSSSQAAERLARLSERCTFIWVPEGVDPSRYRHRSPIERDIDVLQLGRKYDVHHRVIVQPLADAGITYQYEKQKGQIVFPTRDGFVNGLSRSKISICVPSSLTHADRSGDIETMTVRYLQSMISKCLVLGHAPAEMIELFGYNPVVEIDMLSPVEQIMELLADYESWQPLIEKNFETVRTLHTWDQRWQRIAELLFKA
jgi:hypothetical protein